MKTTKRNGVNLSKIAARCNISVMTVSRIKESNAVVCDNQLGSSLAIRHLLGLGRKKEVM